MPRITYVNGRYLAHARATVHVEDRGYQFADGVYEVVCVHDGRLIDEDRHLARLDYSLGQLEIAWPLSRAALKIVAREVVRRNRVRFGTLYCQITRGVAGRNHAFPAGAESALVLSARAGEKPRPLAPGDGVDIVTIGDIRWARRDIKSISLLPNVLGKQAAVAAGAYEAWMIDDAGLITEGTSSNAWIVDGGGAIVTRPLSHDILSGVTRLTLLDLARGLQIPVIERAFTPGDVAAASEAFLTSSTAFVKPVARIDGKTIGGKTIGGKTIGGGGGGDVPGPVAARLMDAYLAHMDRDGD